MKINIRYEKVIMSYKITFTYNWYQTPEDKFLIKTYYINNIPFTFDDVSETSQDDPEIIAEAEKQLVITPEILFKSSFYLIDEEAHPCLFEMDIENPEVLDELQ